MADNPTRNARVLRAVSAGLLLFALVSLGGPAPGQARDRTDYLIRLLRSSDTFRVRAQAALSLGKGDATEKVTKALAGALRDRHPAVRSAAASSLQRLGDPSALPALRLARNDRNETVRKAVRRAIGRLERIARTRPRTTPLPDEGGGAARFYVAVARPRSKAGGVPRSVLEKAREAVAQRVGQMDGVVLAPEGESTARARRVLKKRELLGYTVRSSVVRLEETSSGIRAVVSVVLATYPGSDMRAMLQGAATAPGPNGPETQARAIDGALTGALRRLPQALEAGARRDED